uniref:Uncharacterized protein n=1 Tax=Avena sativa TaxID=4498 RepID=A0ACD5UMN6_AVESA
MAIYSFSTLVQLVYRSLHWCIYRHGKDESHQSNEPHTSQDWTPPPRLLLCFATSPPSHSLHRSTGHGASPRHPNGQTGKNTMASHHRRHLPLYLALLLAFLLPPLASSLWQSCGSSGNFTANSTYQANIQALSVTLPKNASTSRNLFALGSVGTLPDIVYALALCRGDTNASACNDCVSKGFVEAQQLCPYYRDATIYDDPCYIRFSNQNILSATSGDDSALVLMNTQNASAPAKVFDAAVGVLINATADYAAGNSSRRFGTGEEGFETVDKNNPKIYGLAQCRPDMAPRAVPEKSEALCEHKIMPYV